MWIEKKRDNIFKINRHIYKRIISHTKITKQCEDYIVSYVANNNQFKIKNLIRTINRKFLVTISRKSIYLILNKYNFTYKKASFNSRKSTNMQHIKNVKELKHNIDNINNKFISIDEMAIYTNVNRRRAWSDI